MCIGQGISGASHTPLLPQAHALPLGDGLPKPDSGLNYNFSMTSDSV